MTCVHFKIARAVCMQADFSGDQPRLIGGCFANNALEYYDTLQLNRSYDLSQFTIMVKDSEDPYIMAYKLGNINEYYDINSKNFLSVFLQALLALVAVTLLVPGHLPVLLLHHYKFDK